MWEKLKESKMLIFVTVYLSFFLDNVLLTVVVPIIPHFLFSNELNFSSVDLTLTPRSLSPLQRKFEALEKDNGPLGTLLASKAFVQVAITPILGHLSGIVSCNEILLLGSFGMFCTAILFAYGNSYGMLVLARALHGSASAAIAVSGMCLLAESVPKESRAKLMPIALGGTALGVLFGYTFGGAAYQLLGKTAPFLLIAALVAMNIVLQLWCADVQILRVEQRPINLSEWVMVVKDSRALVAAFAIGICTSAMAILESFLPLWLLARISPPPPRWQLGTVFVPDSLGYLVGSHFGGFLPVKPWRIAFSAMILTGLSSWAIPMASSVLQLAVPHLGLGLGVGALDAALVPLLAELVEERGGHYGPIYALQQAAVCLAYALGPFLGGVTIEEIGFPWLMRLIGVLNILFCPFLMSLDDKQEDTLLAIGQMQPSYSTISDETSIDSGTHNHH